ncbi:MAG TPA: lipoyl synthase [Dehalococcoidales bacterium]
MPGRLPPWFKKKIPDPGMLVGMKALFDGLSLHTICESALCPNLGDCFHRSTATFLILGNICTRNCTFCVVEKGIPLPLDEKEPEHLAEAVVKMGLRHVVITSVTRDDLPDGGAAHFARTIALLKKMNNGLSVEVLIPDFSGSLDSLKTVVNAHPDVLNHNMETVPRLYTEVRPKANFQHSLRLLKQAKELNSSLITKSGVMVGLGETRDELVQMMADLRAVDCDLLTIGQYLQPSPFHHPVVRYVPPGEFLEYERLGRAMGFVDVASAPLVRSSFNAERLYEEARMKVERPC